MIRYLDKTFVLRLWQEGRHAPRRVSLRELKSGETRHFGDLETLLEYLKEICEDKEAQ